MAETTSSIKLGILRVAREAPRSESAPALSTRSSRGMPKTPAISVNKLSLCQWKNHPTFLLDVVLVIPWLEQLVPEPAFLDLEQLQNFVQVELILQGRT